MAIRELGNPLGNPLGLARSGARTMTNLVGKKLIFTQQVEIGGSAAIPEYSESDVYYAEVYRIWDGSPSAGYLLAGAFFSKNTSPVCWAPAFPGSYSAAQVLFNGAAGLVSVTPAQDGVAGGAFYACLYRTSLKEIVAVGKKNISEITTELKTFDISDMAIAAGTLTQLWANGLSNARLGMVNALEFGEPRAFVGATSGSVFEFVYDGAYSLGVRRVTGTSTTASLDYSTLAHKG